MHGFPFFSSYHLWLDLRVAIKVSYSLVPSHSQCSTHLAFQLLNLLTVLWMHLTKVEIFVKHQSPTFLLHLWSISIGCTGSISPIKDCPSVTVIPLLSLAPFLATCFEFFSAIVTLAVGTYLDDVWSALMINSSGILRDTTAWTISCNYCVGVSNHIDLVTVGRGVVTLHGDKFIRLWSDWIHPSVIWNSKYMP